MLSVIFLLASTACFSQGNGKKTIELDSIGGAKASQAIQSAMKLIAKSDLDECRGDSDFSNEAGQFFRARQLALAKIGARTWLVTPGDSCISVFHGAHSTAFWILSQSRGRGFRALLATKRDRITILKTYTNGYRDIELIYGLEDPVKWVYSGGVYMESSAVR